MNDEALLRYSRHILLPEIDIEGQQRLLDSHIGIIGLGGLGSPVALYLASSGIGTLTLVDFDHVDLGNLQRQIAHTEDRIGEPKVASATQAINAINHTTSIKTHNLRLTDQDLLSLADQVDILVDCSDNFETRLSVNRACVSTRTPLVSGAAIRFEGQLLIYDPTIDNSPCYQCLYGNQLVTETDCATTGVVAPLVGIFGSLMALEALKLALGNAKDHTGRLTTFDGLTNRWQSFNFQRNANCPSCAP